MHTLVFLIGLLCPLFAASQQTQSIELMPWNDVKTVDSTSPFMTAGNVYGELVAFMYGQGFITALRFGLDPKVPASGLAQYKQDAVTRTCDEAVKQMQPINQIYVYFPQADNDLAATVLIGAPPDYLPDLYLGGELHRVPVNLVANTNQKRWQTARTR